MKKEIGITHFINPIGGRKLYHKDEFDKNGLKLSFLQGREFKYKQFNGEFNPDLSIIDVLMFIVLIKLKLT